MPEDFDEHSSLTPTVVTAIVAVTLFVAVILVVVLMMNYRPSGKRPYQNVADQSNQGNSNPIANNLDENQPFKGGTLRPEDLDFWEMYPEPTEAPTAQPTAEPAEDPSKDGKHTLVQYADGEEEWLLISPYLPKHNYDFTRLVCQSNLMKYYENGKKTSFVGVSISEVQDYVDFVKVKKAGIDFVMLRMGARGYGTGQLILDEYFFDNIKRATDAGLDVGVYFFSQAITTDEAIEEANMVIAYLAEYKIDYPVAFDMERIENDTARTETLSKSEKTTIAKTFLDTIDAAGYKTILYGNKQWLLTEIDMSKLTAYDVWFSQQADIPDYPYRFSMWQYSYDCTVDGIAGYADLSISFINYSEK